MAQGKGLVTRLARKAPALKPLIEGLTPQAPPGEFDAATVEKLAKYVFADRDQPLVVLGENASEAAETLRKAGYDAEPNGRPRGIVLALGLLQTLDDLDDFLANLSEVETLGCLIETYPEQLTRSETTRTFESRDWCNARLIAAGFDPQPPPREDFGPWSPFVCERTAPLSEPGTQVTGRNADSFAQDSNPSLAFRARGSSIAFVTPQRDDVFQWVMQALAGALTGLGKPSQLASQAPGEAVARICWAHYWPAYRAIQAPFENRYDFFVSNFELTPRGGLTDWLDELIARPTPKLTPSTFAAETLTGLGAEDVHVIPHGYAPEFASNPTPLPLATAKRFRFLAMVNSHDPERYGVDLLLEAYRKAFTAEDDVCLVLKNASGDPDIYQSALAAPGPEVLYYANFLSKPRLASFYAACSAFVAPFRGEGFGMKILDAAALGLPLILPLYGGPVDYCPEEFVRPLKFKKIPVGDCLESRELEWREERTWCEPDVDDLAAAMREAYESPNPERAQRLRSHVLEDFSWERAAQKLIEVLEK